MADQHGACASGVKSEKEFKQALVSHGLTVLKKDDDFYRYYENFNFSKEQIRSIYENCMQLTWDKSDKFADLLNGRTVNGKYKKFQPDGYIPELDTRIELKYSEKNGTTQEKVFYDLMKIKEGFYSDKKLIYILFGPAAEQQATYELFKNYVEELDPTGDKVKVFLSSTLDDSIEYILNLVDANKKLLEDAILALALNNNISQGECNV